jgi:large subunit ribosomal protein L10
MSKAVKKMMIEQFREELGASVGTVVLGLSGLDVADTMALRKGCRDKQVKIRVVRNSLAKLALKELGLSALDSHLAGPTAFAFAKADALAAPKAVVEWAKKNKKIEVRGGVIEGRVVSPQDVKNLSSVPGRLEQLSMLCGLIQSPLRGFAALVAAPITDFARLVLALKDSKGESGAEDGTDGG